MESAEFFLLEALIAVLPYVVVGTAGWVSHRVSVRRDGARTPF